MSEFTPQNVPTMAYSTSHMTAHYRGRLAHSIFDQFRDPPKGTQDLDQLGTDIGAYIGVLGLPRRFVPMDEAQLPDVGSLHFCAAVARTLVELREHGPGNTFAHQGDVAAAAGGIFARAVRDFEFDFDLDRSVPLANWCVVEDASAAFSSYLQGIDRAALSVRGSVENQLRNEAMRITGWSHEEYPPAENPTDAQRMATVLIAVAVEHKPRHVIETTSRWADVVRHAFRQGLVVELGGRRGAATELTAKGAGVLRTCLGGSEPTLSSPFGL